MTEEIRKFEVSDRLFVILTIFLIGIFGFLINRVFVDFKNLPENYPREITVSAQGRAFVKPDIALIKLGLTSEGMKIQDITKENREKMNGIIKEIKELGVEEKDIQTIRYNLAPRYEYPEKGERIFKGYTLTQEIRVKIRNFEKIGDVLEKSTQIGANLIGDLQFTIDDPEKIREVALNEAIAKAKAKAAQIASQSGLRLVRLVSVDENYYPSSFKVGEGTRGEFSTASLPAGPIIQPGEEEVLVTVNLVYQVR